MLTAEVLLVSDSVLVGVLVFLMDGGWDGLEGGRVPVLLVGVEEAADDVEGKA